MSDPANPEDVRNELVRIQADISDAITALGQLRIDVGKDIGLLSPGLPEPDRQPPIWIAPRIVVKGPKTYVNARISDAAFQAFKAGRVYVHLRWLLDGTIAGYSELEKPSIELDTENLRSGTHTLVVDFVTDSDGEDEVVQYPPPPPGVASGNKAKNGNSAGLDNAPASGKLIKSPVTKQTDLELDPAAAEAGLPDAATSAQATSGSESALVSESGAQKRARNSQAKSR